LPGSTGTWTSLSASPSKSIRIGSTFSSSFAALSSFFAPAAFASFLSSFFASY
jgi:hypothetical protein